ncbi:PREDICTED: uncharacterized protein LOC109157264 [Ipomoea nil]|uniref:uncharacterized protein LOC109157264 n=1 Tax=Ipomoea nil TaxID=35883 RepID=UPI000900C8C4|nr:PREDICTED: uncharacterized protein LOC109157264 [Ipomoea nil]
MEDITTRWSDITLDDEESGIRPVDEADLPVTTTKKVWTLVGRFLTDRAVKFDAMKGVMSASWRPEKGVKVVEVQANFFPFEFYLETDARFVLEQGPWAFENSSLVCTMLEPGDIPTLIALLELPIWVQVYDLPYGYTADPILEQIGNYVGKFLKLDTVNTGLGRSFFRIRAALDVRKPIKRRMKLIPRDGMWSWILFKYQRLHRFYFYCGMLGHIDRFCALAREAVVDPDKYPFGTWLRTS